MLSAEGKREQVRPMVVLYVHNPISINQVMCPLSDLHKSVPLVAVRGRKRVRIRQGPAPQGRPLSRSWMTLAGGVSIT
jgi:hypothetical protein